MKTLKKSVLVLFVIIIMTVIFCFGASAKTVPASGSCGENVTYTYNSSTGELVISGTGAMTNYLVDESPFCCSDIKSVVINSGVTSISEDAFRDCDSLTSVIIGNSVTSIGSGAFFDCDSLASITIPGSVTSIGASAFSKCTSLKSITIPNSVMSIGNFAFRYCDSLTGITIPNSVTSIGEYAFDGCANLSNITIPDSVTSIGDRAFYNETVIYCNKISYAAAYANKREYPYIYLDGTDEESIFSGKVGKYNWILDKRTGVLELTGSGDMIDFTSVEAPWYEYRYYVTSLKLSDSLTKIGSNSFKDLYRINDIIIPDSVTYIGSSAFSSCNSIKSVTIPDGVTSIGERAFSSCNSLERITIPDGITWISNYAFYCCYNLESITIPDSVTWIGDYAFYCCNSLESITIPDSVTWIGMWTFYGCKSLTSITIPYNVTNVDNFALHNCYSIIDITFALNSKNQSKITSMPNIRGTKVKEIVLPASVKTIGSSVFPSTIEKVTVYNPDCEFYSSCGLGYSHTIIGFKGSTAEKFAEQIGAEFIDVETVHKHSYKTVEDTKATCKKEGVLLKRCTCGKEQSTNRAKLAHTNKTTTTKATLTKNGKVETKCSVCGNVSKTVTVYYPKTITLSATKYTYNKKTKTPAVTVKDSKGNALKKDTDYTVKYESGRKLPGKYTVTVTFKGKYSGTKKLTFAIAPRATSKITATQTTSTITLKWTKVTGATGYRVYKYNTKTKKHEKITSVKDASYKLEKLKAGTTYKFKVVAYTKDDGTIWGAYSKVFETATKPATPKITKLTTTKGKASFAWSNVSGESGYQVYYSTKKDSGYKKVASYKTNVVKGSKSKLTSGKKYYFKVRAYKKTASGTVYSSFSAVKSMKIK